MRAWLAVLLGLITAVLLGLGVFTACVGRPDIQYYVISLPDDPASEQRLAALLAAARGRFSPTVIPAVKGRDVDDDPRVRQFFARLPIGKEFEHYGQRWAFDGRPSTGFAALNPHPGHAGTKGLWLSNLLVMQAALNTSSDAPWVCILEDDANITGRTVPMLKWAAGVADLLKMKVVGADVRGWGGATAVLYRRETLTQLIDELSPDGWYPQHSKNTNLWDWMLYDYLNLGCSPSIMYSPLVGETGADSVLNEPN